MHGEPRDEVDRDSVAALLTVGMQHGSGSQRKGRGTRERVKTLLHLQRALSPPPPFTDVSKA